MVKNNYTKRELIIYIVIAMFFTSILSYIFIPSNDVNVNNNSDCAYTEYYKNSCSLGCFNYYNMIEDEEELNELSDNELNRLSAIRVKCSLECFNQTEE